MTKNSTKTADLFNRSILDMSFTLLRNKEPKLALQIRNIVFNQSVIHSKNTSDNKNADLFKVKLSPSQISAIVENLNQILQESLKLDPTENTSIFRPILIESILKEWSTLKRS
ncbi:MAG: hypothetical protein ACC653_04270 [Gammaproteobacteria bacterium]